MTKVRGQYPPEFKMPAGSLANASSVGNRKHFWAAAQSVAGFFWLLFVGRSCDR